MKEFEKYARQQLDAHGSPVDEARLWENIDKALRKDKRRPLWLWLSGIGLFLAAAGFSLFYLTQKNQSVTQINQHGIEQPTGLDEQGLSQSIITADSTLQQSYSSDEAPAQSDDFEASERSSGISKQRLPVSAAPPTNGKTRQQNETPRGAALSEISGEQHKPGRGVEIVNQIARKAAAFLVSDLSESSSETPALSDVKNPQEYVLAQTVFLPTLLHFPTWEQTSAVPLPSKQKTGCPVFDKGPAFKPYFGVYGGGQFPIKSLHAKQVDYQGIVQLRDKSETVLEGVSVGAYTGIMHRSGIFAEAGLEYNRINERFDRTTVKTDTIGKIAVVGIIINAPGDTTYIQDSVDILQETRTVSRIYNNYRFLQVPIALGYEWQASNRWSFYLKGGVAINLRFRQKAAMFNLNGERELFKSESAGPGYPFRSTIQLSPFANVGARYWLSPNLSIFGEVRYLQHLGEITTGSYPIKQQYKLPGGNVGLHLQF